MEPIPITSFDFVYENDRNQINLVCSRFGNATKNLVIGERDIGKSQYIKNVCQGLNQIQS